MVMILILICPAGVTAVTVSPALCPSKASPMGEL
jgi:hypothetical protein